MKLSEAPEFLSFEILELEIDRYAYKPGWDLSVFHDPWEGPCLYVETTVENSFRTNEALPLRIRSAIPPIPDTEYFGHWLLWRLGQIELHEAREFLRRDGEMLFDPHDPIEPDAPGDMSSVANSTEGMAQVIESLTGMELNPWQTSMANAATNTLRDLSAGLRGWNPGGPVGRLYFGAQPTDDNDESTPDYEPQFVVKGRLAEPGTWGVGVWDRAKKDWASPKIWADTTEGRSLARVEAQRLNTAGPEPEKSPRFEVRDRDTGRELGPAVWDTARDRWAAPKGKDRSAVIGDRAYAQRIADRLNNAPRVFAEYGEIPSDLMMVMDWNGNRWLRHRPHQNVWSRVYPDGSSMGSVSPYDDRMLPCIEDPS